MSDITKRNGSTLPSTTDFDAFAAFSGMGTGEREVGEYLSFSHGEWLYGRDKRTLPMGTKLVANMPGLRYGWRRWLGNKPVEDLRRPVVERPPNQVEPRASLGDMDQSLWDTMSGKKVDPWQLTMTVEMIDGRGEQYILSMQAVTHLPTFMALATTYSKEGRLRPGQLPLVELGASFFMHRDKTIGKVHTPVLTVVGWVDGETHEPVEDIGGTHEIPFDVSPADPAASAPGGAPPAAKGLDGQPAKAPISAPGADPKKPRAPRF